RAAGQLPGEPGIDGAEREPAGVGFRARARNVVENPADLACGEIGVDEEPGLRLDGLGRAAGLQPLAELGGAAILPDDRVVNGVAGRAIPDDRRFTLIGDAERRDVGGTHTGARERFGGDADLRRPDFVRVVLDPSGLRKQLCEFLLRHRHDFAVPIEDDGTRAGGALIERENAGHVRVGRSKVRLYNTSAMTKAPLREVLAEFLGTFVLIVFGVGVVAQVVLSRQTAGTYLSIHLAWGLAVTMGCYVSAGVTGAHLNPAVTLALAAHRRFPWNKVVAYSLAQLAGAFVASAVVFVTYREAISTFDNGVRQVIGPMGTAGSWATYPQPLLSVCPGG